MATMLSPIASDSGNADDALWRAVLGRDAALDGRLFYGVRSTRVYCRPSCPSPRARRDRVVFFDGWQRAEHAGFRPCRRCEPRVFADALDKRRLDGELRLAALVQSRLQPAQAPELPGWDIAGSSRPCRELGGDYYDFVVPPRERRLVVALGDVAGKGVAAALLTASLHAAVRAHVGAGASPVAVARALDRYLGEVTEAHEYATLFCAEIDLETGSLAWVNAGHPPALLLRANGGADRLHAGGPPLGLLPGAEFTGGACALEPGDVLLVSSDGLSEACDTAGHELGTEGLLELATTGHRSGSAEALRAELCAAVASLAGDAPASDDRTLVVVRRLSSS